MSEIFPKLDPDPKIEPLRDSIDFDDLGEFLKSRDFKRFCIQVNLDKNWRSNFEYVKKHRTIFLAGFDHDEMDLEECLTLTMNQIWDSDKHIFFIFIQDFLYTYTKWSKKDFRVKEIKEDLELLEAPKYILEKVESFQPQNEQGVPNIPIPEVIDSKTKLERCLNEMDLSINKAEYNLTLTYAYSSLEGLFKAYIAAKVSEIELTNDLSKNSKIVKDHIKSQIAKNQQEYPVQMINLISTITNAVSNARNQFSESHFGGSSDLWLAEFTRDCTNSVGRLILKFIN